MLLGTRRQRASSRGWSVFNSVWSSGPVLLALIRSHGQTSTLLSERVEQNNSLRSAQVIRCGDLPLCWRAFLSIPSALQLRSLQNFPSGWFTGGNYPETWRFRSSYFVSTPSITSAARPCSTVWKNIFGNEASKQIFIHFFFCSAGQQTPPAHFFSQQTSIASFCIEGLELTRDEGLRLVAALFNSRNTLTDLYCWRAFRCTEGPLLVDSGHLTGSGLYKDRVPRKEDWFGAIGCLESLTRLSINYAYLATPDGDLLVAMSKLLPLTE